jgi:hypothetical protein
MDARNLGATSDEVREYGTTLSLWEALRLLQRWAPLIGYARSFVATADPYRRSLVVAEACGWLARQTDTTVDDELVRHVSAVLVTREGEALVRFCLHHAGAKS